ncbi:MAG: hypothetical protein Q4A23_00565 [bacterium]|nr:hypothetical protein [bacterium]
MQSNKQGSKPSLLFILLVISSIFYIYKALAIDSRIINKSNIKDEIIKKGDSFTVNNNQLKEYIDILDDLEINYTLKKSGDSTNININR